MMTAREGGGTCASLVLLAVASLAAAGVLRAPSGIGGGGISGGTGGARVGGVGVGGYVLRRFPEASGALCLDGTLGGVYVRQARGAADAKGERGLIIHLQGGGWCTSADECALRSESELGSAASWPARRAHLEGVLDQGDFGIFSGNESVAGRWSGWAHAWLMYCDGASSSGDREEAVWGTSADTGENRTLFFRGRRHIDALPATLAAAGVLRQDTTDVLITGSSAGGLAVLLHADALADVVRAHAPRAHVAAFSDSGIFPHIRDFEGHDRFKGHYAHVAHMQHVRVGDGNGCAAAHPHELFRCFLSEVALEHVRTPLFVFAWAHDTWQAANLAHVECVGRAFDCDGAEAAALDELAVRVRTAVRERVRAEPRTGAFVLSCRGHAGTTVDRVWEHAAIRGVKLRDVFQRWYAEGSVGGVRVVGGDGSAAGRHAHFDCGGSVEGEPGWECNQACAAVELEKYSRGCKLVELSPGNVACIA